MDNTKNIVNNIEKNLTNNISENISSNILNNQISNNSLDNTKTVITENQEANINLPQLQDMIFQSAQRSRGNFLDQSQTVSKLGILAPNAFKDSKEIVNFSELMSKSFKIGGASQQEQSAGMYQLTQAMASGRLQGDEFRSIMENAPMLAQAISKYTGVSVGTLREMSSEGKITADVIKNAMFYIANDINKKFESIPTTFNDVVVNLKSNFIRAYEPISARLSNLFNSSNFKTFTGMLITGMTRVINLTVSGMDIISKFATVMKNNWDVISPALGAVTFGVLAYKSSLIMANAELIKNNILQGKNIIGSITMAGKNLYLAASTFLGTVAQEGFNAALYACPITWIVGGIMLLIGALYAGVAAFNAITGKSVSATGIITGGIGMIVATVINMGATIWNTLLSVAEFMMNVFTHPIYAIKKMIGDFILDFIDNLKFLAGVSDKVLGTEFTASLNDAETWVNTKLTQEKPENYADISDLRADFVNPFEIGKDFYNYGSNPFSFGSGLENPEMAKMNLQECISLHRQWQAEDYREMNSEV